MNINWLNKIWPWSTINKLESSLADSIKREKVSSKSSEDNLSKLQRVTAVSQSYREMVSYFQSYCERRIPADIWRALIAGYIRQRAPHITSVAEKFGAAGFTPRSYPYNLDPVESQSKAMTAAWEDLRAKWQLPEIEEDK
jgi:hypothetical protein